MICAIHGYFEGQCDICQADLMGTISEELVMSDVGEDE